MIKSKSPFDTGNWSEVNGLPGQQDMVNFLQHLTQTDPNKNFTRRQLMDEVAKEFEIPATAQEAEGPKSTTPGYYTRLTYLISGAVLGKWRSEGKPFLKRIEWSVYQHITGNGTVSREMRAFLKTQPKVSKKYVEEARVSVKLLKDLKYDAEAIMVELGGRLWSDEIIEAAINLEFDNHPKESIVAA